MVIQGIVWSMWMVVFLPLASSCISSLSMQATHATGVDRELLSMAASLHIHVVRLLYGHYSTVVDLLVAFWRHTDKDQ